MEMIDRIERLAFQAGVGAAAREPANPVAEHAVLKKLRATVLLCGGSVGVALYGPTVADNIEWAGLIEWAKG